MPWLIAQIEAVWMFLAGVGLLTYFLLRRSFRYFGRHTKPSHKPIEHLTRPASTWDGSQRDMFAQIERQKVEMEEMARDLNGQLNTKIMVLEQLISDSQRQLERMETMLAENFPEEPQEAAASDSIRE